MRTRLRVLGITAATAVAAVAVPLVTSSAAHAGGFTGGDVVVYRVGDGGSALTNAAAPVFLDEYTSGGTKVQSVALPTTSTRGQHPAHRDRPVAVGGSHRPLRRRPLPGRDRVRRGARDRPTGVPDGGLSLTTTSPTAVPARGRPGRRQRHRRHHHRPEVGSTAADHPVRDHHQRRAPLGHRRQRRHRHHHPRLDRRHHRRRRRLQQPSRPHRPGRPALQLRDPGRPARHRRHRRPDLGQPHRADRSAEQPAHLRLRVRRPHRRRLPRHRPRHPLHRRRLVASRHDRQVPLGRHHLDRRRLSRRAGCLRHRRRRPERHGQPGGHHAHPADHVHRRHQLRRRRSPRATGPCWPPPAPTRSSAASLWLPTTATPAPPPSSAPRASAPRSPSAARSRSRRTPRRQGARTACLGAGQARQRCLVPASQGRPPLDRPGPDGRSGRWGQHRHGEGHRRRPAPPR